MKTVILHLSSAKHPQSLLVTLLLLVKMMMMMILQCHINLQLKLQWHLILYPTLYP